MLTLVSFGRGILDRFPKKRKEGYEYPVSSLQLRSLKQKPKAFSRSHIGSASSSEDDLNLPSQINIANQHFLPVYTKESDHRDIAGTYCVAEPNPDHNLDIASFSQKLESWLAERLAPASDSPFDEKQSFIAQDSLDSLLECALCIYEAGKPFVGETADHLSVDDIRGVFAASVLRTRDPGFRQELVRKILGNSHIQPTVNLNDGIQSGDIDTGPLPRSPTLSSTTDGFSSAHTAVPSLYNWDVSFKEPLGDIPHVEEEQHSVDGTPQPQTPQTKEVCIVDEKLMFFQSHTETVPKHPTYKPAIASRVIRWPGLTLSGELGGYTEPTAIEAQIPGTHKENSTLEQRAIYTETMTLESAGNKSPNSVAKLDEPNIHGGDTYFNTLQPEHTPDHIATDTAAPVVPEVEEAPSPPPESYSTLSIPEISIGEPNGYLSDSAPRKPRKGRVSFVAELPSPTQSDDDDTRLHDAIRRDDLHTVCYLLEKGIDIFKENINTTIARLPANAIAYSVKYRRKDILSYFIRHDIKCYPTAIWETLRYGDDELREFITEKYKERKSQLDLIKLLSYQDRTVRPELWGSISQQRVEPSALDSQVTPPQDRIKVTNYDNPTSESDVEGSQDFYDGDSDILDEDGGEEWADDDGDGEDSIAALKAVYLVLRVLLQVCGGDSTQSSSQLSWEASSTDLLPECIDGSEGTSVPNESSSSSVSGPGTGSNQHTNRAPKRSRASQGEKDSDDNDDSNRRPTKKQAIKDDDGTGAFGCPYAIGNPDTYRKCLRIRRQDLSGVKEHLKRRHFNNVLPPDLYRRRSWEDVFKFCNEGWAGVIPSHYPAIAELVEMALQATRVDHGLAMPDTTPIQRSQSHNCGDSNLGVAQTPEQGGSTPGCFNDLTPQDGSAVYQPSPHTPRRQAVVPEPESGNGVLDPSVAGSHEGMLEDSPHNQAQPAPHRIPLHQPDIASTSSKMLPLDPSAVPVGLPKIPPTIRNASHVPSQARPAVLSSPFQPKQQYSTTTEDYQRQILGNLATSPHISPNTTTSPDFLYALDYLHPTISPNENSSQQTKTMLPPSTSSSSSLLVDSVNQVIGQSSQLQASRKPFLSAWRPPDLGNITKSQTPKSTPRSESPSHLSMGHEISTPRTQISDADTVVATPRPYMTQSSSVINSSPSGNKKYTVLVRQKPPAPKKYYKFYLNSTDDLKRDFNGWMADSFPGVQFSWDKWDLQNLDNEERICDMEELVEELEITRWLGRGKTKTPFYLVPKLGTKNDL
ncbi:hypothetical protein TWF281_007442 [Arthrobotrys megalospora]